MGTQGSIQEALMIALLHFDIHWGIEIHPKIIFFQGLLLGLENDEMKTCKLQQIFKKLFVSAQEEAL